jgi:predicted transcriptional regulator of viral defense system
MSASRVYFRPKDLPDLGYSAQIRRLSRQGRILRIVRGLYRWSDAPAASTESLSAVGLRTPNAVVCLPSALSFHEIGTLGSTAGLDRSRDSRSTADQTRSARPGSPLLPRGMAIGVDRHKIAGVTVSVTNPARTIVDCFRYRRKIGLDVPLQALEDALRRKIVTRGRLMRMAEPFRQQSVMRPHLEAFSR